MVDLTAIGAQFDPKTAFADWYATKTEYTKARNREFAARQYVAKQCAQQDGIDLTVSDYRTRIDLGSGYVAKVESKFKFETDQAAAQMVINDWFARGLGEIAKKVFKTKIEISQTELKKLPDNLRKEAIDCLIEKPAPATITIEKDNDQGINWRG